MWGWAHARRKFVEAQDTCPSLAVIAVAHIKVLYDIEKDAARREHDVLGLAPRIAHVQE